MKQFNFCAFVLVLGGSVAACGGGEASSGDTIGKTGTGGSKGTGLTPTEAGGLGTTGSTGIPAVGGMVTVGAGGTHGTVTYVASSGTTFTTGSTGVIPIAAGGSVIGMPIPIYNGGGAPPTPVNCQQASLSAATDSCQVELRCDNDDIFTSCYAQGGGVWSCSCSGMYSAQSYAVSGGTSKAACAAIADLCGSGTQPTATETRVCTTPTDYSGVGYCEFMEQCNVSSAVAPGVTATFQDYKYVNCSDNGGKPLCNCSKSQSSKSYELSSSITSTSCRTISALCDNEVVFSAAPTCQPTYQYVASGNCQLQQDCTTSASVAAGITALSSDQQSGQCQDLKNGNSACACYGNQKSIRFDLPSASTTISTCVTAQSVCTSTEPLVLADPVKCEATYQSASAQSCDAQLSCNQAATQAGQQLLVYGDLYVSCQPKASGTAWSCTCSSGANLATLAVEGASGWAVCTTAAQLCPAQVKVAIGSSNGGVSPVPVPGGILPI